jgi:hypothetical protein
VKVKVGDWVRFRRDGALVIGVVEYIRKAEVSFAVQEIDTDKGQIHDTAVLECRPAASTK